MQALRDEPGLNKRELARKVDTAPSSANRHLAHLEQAGLVFTGLAPKGTQVHCFRAEDEPLWQRESTRILFGHERVRQVARFYLDNPGQPARAAVEELGLDVSTIRHHLRSLTDCGLVEKIQIGRRVLYEPRRAMVRWFRLAAEAGP